MNLCELIFPATSVFASENWHPKCLDLGIVSSFASVAFLAVLFALLVWVLRQVNSAFRQTGKPGLRGILPALSAVIAALMLAIAAGNPIYVFREQESSDHIIVLVDQSESTHRLVEERAEKLEQAVTFLEKAEAKTIGGLKVSVIDFAVSSFVRIDRGSVAGAARLLRSDTPSEALLRSGSDIQVALDEAKRLAEEDLDSDMAILISDGNDTVTGMQDIASKAAGKYSSIFALAVNAGAPAEGIVSSYLPAAVESNTEPNLRLVFDPGENVSPSTTGEIRLSRNGTPVPLEQDKVLLDGSIESLRLAMPFEGRGIQFAKIELLLDQDNYWQRVFTLVKSKIRVLGLGDAGFLSSLSTERFDVDYARPDDPLDVSNYDVLVLGSVYADELPTDLSDKIVNGVSRGGLGLFVVNGPMKGTTQRPTVIQSYDKTVIDPLLPVSPDPKFLLVEPPPRDIVVLVDTSPSMAGGGLNAARKAIKDIADYMRPVDSIQVITFGGVPSGQLSGTDQGKIALDRFTGDFPSDDLSNVTAAFDAALKVVGNYTSVFLITDGDIDDGNYARPGLSFYYLEYGNGYVSNGKLAAAARRADVLGGSGLGFVPQSLKPEEKTAFFAPDPITPVVVTPVEGVLPGIQTNGVALSYARIDAVRVLISDSPDAEPLLAFRDSGGLGGGQTAAFLSAFDGALTGTQNGRQSLEAIISKLSKWSQRSRYKIAVSDFGRDLELWISIVANEGGSGLPDDLTLTLIRPDSQVGVPMQKSTKDEGVFTGRISLNSGREGEAISGLLVLQENGANALAQAQSIPIKLPPAEQQPSGLREAASFGVDLQGLYQLAANTGGDVNRLPGIGAGQSKATTPSRPIYLILMAIGAILFALAMLGKVVRL